MDDSFVCKCILSNEVDSQFESDFIDVHQTVFGSQNFTKEKFRRKYMENIYGDSILVVVYTSKGEPVASRALWRNDIGGKTAYQPGGTCVKKKYRRKGIFILMTKEALSKLKPGVLIYNFPNQNSLPQYLKLGWSIHDTFRTRLFLSVRSYRKEHPTKIDPAYFQWWIAYQCKGKIFAVKRGKVYLLVKKTIKRGRYCVYYVIGEIDKEVAQGLKQVHLLMLAYMSKKETFYNKKLGPLRVITLGATVDTYIPIHKMDAI